MKNSETSFDWSAHVSAAQINALVVETSAALALMALEGRVRLGMGFVYFAPACKDSNYAPNLLPPSN